MKLYQNTVNRGFFWGDGELEVLALSRSKGAAWTASL